MNEVQTKGYLRWPPYAVVLATLVAMQVAFMVVVYFAIGVAVSRGLLSRFPDGVTEAEKAIEIAVGGKSKQLALSLAINSVVLFVAAVWASSVGLPRGSVASRLVHRLRLGAPSTKQVIIAVLGLIGLTTALDSIVVLLGLHDFGALPEMRATIDSLEGTQRVLFAFLIGIGPGVTEELLFRGYLLNRISAAQGTRVGLAVSSIVFGALHIDVVHASLAMIMGLYLGACLIRTGSLWVPIAAHSANNVLATVSTEWTPTELQASLLVPLGLIASGAAITLLSRDHPPLSRRAAVW